MRSVSFSGLTEVPRSLIRTRALFFELTHEIVEQGGCAESVAAVVQPFVTERFFDGDEKMQCLLGGADAARRLHRNGNAGGEEMIANGFDHDLIVAERGVGRCFARARFDKVVRAEHAHRQKACGANVVIGFELADFENDFQRRFATGIDHSGDLVLHEAEFSTEKRAAIDHHVDFVRAVVHGGMNFSEACLERCLPRGKRGGDGSDLYACAADMLLGVLHHGRIDADGSSLRNVIPIMRTECLLTERGDFARCVLAFERGQIDHRDSETKAEDLRLLLDAAGGVLRHAFLDADMIDGADFIEQSAEASGRASGWHEMNQSRNATKTNMISGLRVCLAHHSAEGCRRGLPKESRVQSLSFMGLSAHTTVVPAWCAGRLKHHAEATLRHAYLSAVAVACHEAEVFRQSVHPGASAQRDDA